MGCRQGAPQDELLRVVRTPDGDLEVGRTLPGRGAWLCAATPVPCLDLADRRRAWPRAFRAAVTSGAVARLRAVLTERSG